MIRKCKHIELKRRESWSHNKPSEYPQMMLPFLLLLATLTAASPSLYICPYNRFGQYYIVFGPNPQKADQAGQQFNGMPFDLYPTACAMHELRPANITADIVPDITSLIQECQQFNPPPNIPGAWFNSYEGLPPARDCNAFAGGYVISSNAVCEGSSLLALCEVPIDAVVITTTTTTANQTVTEGVTSLLTTVFLSTETVTDFFVTRITTVITQGTSTVTTLTTTSTSCSTITRTYTSTCCHDHHHSRSCKPCKTTTTSTTTRFITPTRSDSSSSSDGCPPDHHRRRDHHRHGCRDCGAKIQKDVNELKSTKPVKAPAVPDAVQQSYIECTTSDLDFYLVRVNGGGGGDNKLAKAANINGVEACNFFGYNFANITIPILSSLATLFSMCLVEAETFVYNSYYAYTPLCGIVQYGSADGVVFSDVDAALCEAAQWALCHIGQPIVTTSTVTTGPFSTNTLNITRTETQRFTETVLITETITENDIMTVTDTSFFPVTSTTSTTEPTTTVIQTSVSVTSCCCNPVVCTTVQECCKPKPTCHKPGCHRPHHH